MKLTLTPLLHFLFFFLFFQSTAFSQILTSSELPIVIIETEEDYIPDEPKVFATMGIIDNGEGEINHIDDDFNHYDGYIGIETRGNSTQGFDKKTYTVELWDEEENEIDAPLLGMGEEEDWILHGMVIDKTQLRIPMSFYLHQQMGHYASNWRFVEVIINDEYQGLYILTENIKRDKNRVDIAKLDSDEISGDDLTGGYILRIDWLDDPEGFESNYDAQAGDPMFYQWHYPKADKIEPEQADYIEGWMHTFEDAVFNPNYTNVQGKRYTDYIDVTSFTDFLLINELSKNSDGYKLSTYMHKDKDSKGGKLVAGPIWDFDQTYGVSLVCSNHDYEGWTYLQNQDGCEDLETMPMWWQAMMSDEVFVNHLKCRWETMREGAFHQEAIMEWIDEQGLIIENAIDRNFELWDYFIGESIWIEPEPIPETYEEEITYMKNWIINRLNWLDDNMPGNCAEDVVSINNIDKQYFEINPNPAGEYLSIKGQVGDQFIFSTANGQSIKKVVLAEKQQTINLINFPKGTYFVTVIGNDFVKTEKLIVQ